MSKIFFGTMLVVQIAFLIAYFYEMGYYQLVPLQSKKFTGFGPIPANQVEGIFSQETFQLQVLPSLLILRQFVPYYIDLLLFIFVGLTIQISFRKLNNYHQFIYCLLGAALAIQLALVWQYTWMKSWGKLNQFDISLRFLFIGVQAAVGALISLGTMLGKINSTQIVIMILLEVMTSTLNSSILAYQIESNDLGLNQFVFGSVFGIVCSIVYTDLQLAQDYKNFKNGDNSSKLISLIGTLFLITQFPSFNSCLQTDNFLKHSHMAIYIQSKFYLQFFNLSDFLKSGIKRLLIKKFIIL